MLMPRPASLFISVTVSAAVTLVIVNVYLKEQVFSLMTNPTLKARDESSKTKDNIRTTRKNVLFIIADDLRPQLGAYHDPDYPDYYTKNKMHTPHLDELSSKSLLLTRAYVQLPLCGPSRVSILTSRRPDVTQIYNNDVYFREAGGNFTTLPQYFKENGYVSLGFGKVFHKRGRGNKDDPPSWSEKFYKPPFTDVQYLPRQYGAGWFAVDKEAREKVSLTDDKTIDEAIKALRTHADSALNGTQPFFFAVGFRKPHLSFICPEEFFSLYPLETDEQYLSHRSWQSPIVSTSNGLGNTTDVDGEKQIPDDILRNLRRAYSACASYVDSKVGLLVEELNKLGLADSTVISFMADHGYHLGENKHFGKLKPMEHSTRIPLMVHVPGQTDAGIISHSLVEALDVFPTLVQASGLNMPTKCPTSSSDVQTCTMGQSLMPLIKNRTKELRKVAVSQVTGTGSTTYTVRSTRFRYSEMVKFDKIMLDNKRLEYTLNWESSGNTTELFDHENDHDESENVAGEEKYKKEQAELSNLLHDIVSEMFVESKRL